MTDTLCYCHPKCTCVVEANIQTVWQIVKQWSTFYFLDSVAGNDCVIKLYEGEEHKIGSVRSVQIGPSLMFERLVAMDDETYMMKWRTINHPDSVTPFREASYINAILSLTLRDVTHNDHTFAEWDASFYTEQEYAEEMYEEMEQWLIGALTDLQKHVFTPEPEVDHRGQQQPHAPPQESSAVDHLARFADLHVDPGTTPFPPIANSAQRPEQAYQLPRGPPAMDGVTSMVPQANRPIGASSQQSYQQAWPQPEPSSMHPSIPAGHAAQQQNFPGTHDWIARQHREQRRRLNHPIGGTRSERSFDSRDSLERPSRQSRSAMAPPESYVRMQPMQQAPPSWREHEHSPIGLNQNWEGAPIAGAPMMGPPVAGHPMGAPQMAFPTMRATYEPSYHSEYFDDARSQASRSTRSQYRGTR